MALYDQHLHSWHSFDSKADPAANVKAAIAKGLAGLTFTEHFDQHPNDRKACTYNDKSYSKTIDNLRKEFGKQVFIGKGIEVCYQPAQMEFILDFLSSHEFDLVMLSVHYFGLEPLHKRSSWTKTSALQGTQKYLETVLEAVRFCEQLRDRGERRFDVLGHLDLVKRYTKRFLSEYDLSPFSSLIDEILKGCLAADLIPEINTSTLRQGLDEAMPGPSTIRRYVDLGGTCMSLGSDAHRSEDIGEGIDWAAHVLQSAGIQELAIFENRLRTTIPIL